MTTKEEIVDALFLQMSLLKKELTTKQYNEVNALLSEAPLKSDSKISAGLKNKLIELSDSLLPVCFTADRLCYLFHIDKEQTNA